MLDLPVMTMCFGAVAASASADAFEVFETRCVEPMFAFAEFSAEGLSPVPSERETVAQFAVNETLVRFDVAPQEGRRACAVMTGMDGAEARFTDWVAALVAREELEPVSETAWLTTYQVEPRLALEISAGGDRTTFWLTETNLEADQHPHVEAWAVPLRGE